VNLNVNIFLSTGILIVTKLQR